VYIKLLHTSGIILSYIIHMFYIMQNSLTFLTPFLHYTHVSGRHYTILKMQYLPWYSTWLNQLNRFSTTPQALNDWTRIFYFVQMGFYHVFHTWTYCTLVRLTPSITLFPYAITLPHYSTVCSGFYNSIFINECNEFQYYLLSSILFSSPTSK
jgi:hypothetical protein